MKIYIYPHVDIYYCGFYIQALERKYGRENIVYTTTPFGDMPKHELYKVHMVLIADDGVVRKRIVFDTYDYNIIRESLYQWCDIYAHCNANFTKYAKDKWPKLVSLCASFGVKCWSDARTLWHVLNHYCKLHFYYEPKRNRLAWRYYKQMQKAPYSEYNRCAKIPTEENYVFHCSTLWYNNACRNNDEGLNLYRKHFIDACRSIPGMNVRGGLVVRKRSSAQAYKFEGYLMKGVSQRVWMEETAKSVVVFNTPAFWECHGWKLGEYLALGKCIISTPLYNDLPAPLEHGVNIHYIENTEESMREAVTYIVEHPEYRKKLEEGAREYWLKYGTPEKSLERIGL